MVKKFATIMVEDGLMDWLRKIGTADTESQGREPNEFEPREFDGLRPERPLDSGDATGAPTPKRYKR